MAGERKEEQVVKAEPNTNQTGMCVITVCADTASADQVRQATLREYCNFAGELQDYSPREGELQPLLKLQNAEASVCVIDFDKDHERAVQAANTLAADAAWQDHADCAVGEE